MSDGVFIKCSTFAILIMLSNVRITGYDPCKYRTGCHRLLHRLHVSGSEVLCCNNRKSRRNSLQEANDQKYQCSTCSYRRQCRITDKFPDDHRICHIIKLLKNITDKDRHCKIENDLPGVPAVISFSILFSSFSVICVYRYLSSSSCLLCVYVKKRP